jgi:hypothetical protein
MADIATPTFEPLEYDPRYYIQTAKNNITSFAQVIAEAVSNADEAISARARENGAPDSGSVTIIYGLDSKELIVADDGIGMLTETMRKRLRHVGAAVLSGSRRSFFHRGIREVFTAMGVSTVDSVALKDGQRVFSRAVFDPHQGMAIVVEDEPADDHPYIATLIPETGTAIRVPLGRLHAAAPRNFTFSSMETQISDCVQIRPVLQDPNRSIQFIYGESDGRRMEFKYPAGETLIAEHEIEIGGYRAKLWARASDKPIKSRSASRQTRRNGILIRGERAAYEVTTGQRLRHNPGMQQIFGELRIDDIERIQREEDAAKEDEAQLIYKADRSGLNEHHPLAVAIYEYIDTTFSPLVGALENKETSRMVSRDLRRQLTEIARIINSAVDNKTQFGDLPTDDTGRKTGDTDPIDRDPPKPPEEQPPPTVEDGIAFAYDRIFVRAEDSRKVKVWFDTKVLPPGTPVSVIFGADEEVLLGVSLSGSEIPEPPDHGIAELLLEVRAGDVEGRDEVTVAAGEYAAVLPVHVRFKRASGFISQIVPSDKDWESGSALWDEATGRVTVFLGRPEFKEAERQAKRDKFDDPTKAPLYRQLIVESVREAALRPAAQRNAEVEWDELSYEERQEHDAFFRLVLTEYYRLDYQLRNLLLKAFVDV